MSRRVIADRRRPCRGVRFLAAGRRASSGKPMALQARNQPIRFSLCHRGAAVNDSFAVVRMSSWWPAVTGSDDENRLQRRRITELNVLLSVANGARAAGQEGQSRWFAVRSVTGVITTHGGHAGEAEERSSPSSFTRRTGRRPAGASPVQSSRRRPSLQRQTPAPPDASAVEPAG